MFILSYPAIHRSSGMKVLMINGSTRKNGCVFRALSEIAGTFEEEGIDSEILQMGSSPVWDCVGCDFCRKGGDGHCVFDGDMVNGWIEKAKVADGYVFASPVYFAHPAGQLLSIMERMFYAAGDVFAHKPAAAVVTARKAGATSSLDVIAKHFTDNSMPIVSSTYWNMVHGTKPEDLEIDAEGLQTMRNLGRNMAWIMKTMNKEIPELEHDSCTSFVR